MPSAAALRLGPACAARADGYARRRPETTVLYEVVRDGWPAFLARADEQGGLPKFVVGDFEAYLRCGLLEHGLVRVRCEDCCDALVVAFSCKRRGFCPSCVGRRMSDVAAHLVDDVIPEVPVRQWVCSLPWRLRAPLGYDRALCSDVLGAFAGALDRSLRRRAKRALGLRSVADAHTGFVTFLQRCDSSLRLNPHFHTIALDGVYVRDTPDATPRFVPLDAPSADEVTEVAAWTHARLVKVLARHGRSLDGPDDAADALGSEQPVLASCYAASAADVQLLGETPGARTGKLGRPVAVRAPTPSRAAAAVGGVDVHASVAVDGRDRPRLERLCRYVARPPLSLDRLSRMADGRVKVAFKRAWKDGTDAVLLSPADFIARLCALVPPPRFHLHRYHGVLSAHATLREEVVGSLDDDTPRDAAGGDGAVVVQMELFDKLAGAPSGRAAASDDAGDDAPRASRHSWSWLLARVFAVDVTVCARCGGKMKLVQVATTPDAIARVLGELGLGPRAPPTARPAPAGQLALGFDDEE